MNNDELIMTNILSLIKGGSGLYMHATIEASCPKINAAFKQMLSEGLVLQKEVFDAMEQKGWYMIAEETKKNVDKVIKKFASGA